MPSRDFDRRKTAGLKGVEPGSPIDFRDFLFATSLGDRFALTSLEERFDLASLEDLFTLASLGDRFVFTSLRDCEVCLLTSFLRRGFVGEVECASKFSDEVPTEDKSSKLFCDVNTSEKRPKFDGSGCMGTILLGFGWPRGSFQEIMLFRRSSFFCPSKLDLKLKLWEYYCKTSTQ